ncbi:uncharacterized protein G2W53_039765 [Senna tora]|uniref:Uncharacterized protein n=1 Tax=Senna tora TaxID=362788 RepID=A0A834W8A5_9FABA|nr:uncharacterized protein G2W53_039765 [Senna tora]
MAVWQWRKVAEGLTLVAIGGAMERRNKNEENKVIKRRDLTLRKKQKQKEIGSHAIRDLAISCT